MVNRILIRIKVVQIVYSFLKSDKDINATEKELFLSLDKAYDLYHYLMLLMIELTDLQRRKQESAKAKYLPTSSELNPETRFVENRFITALRNDPQFVAYTSQQKLSWVNEANFVKKILEEILASDYYANYMSAEESSFESDRHFWYLVFKNIIAPNETLNEVLEDQSLYWNDDLETIATFVLKTMKRFEENPKGDQLLPQFRSEDDIDFARQLFRKSILEADRFEALIGENSKNWDLERIAFMDIVIMIVALAEITTFPLIPVKVSLNEYIEIAKAYSTQRSGRFINGILDGVIANLKKQGLITK